MKEIDKVLHDDESVLVSAEISNTFYNGVLSLYALGGLLLLISYELQIGLLGIVLIVRTVYVHRQEMKEKKSYHCLLTEHRVLILKGRKSKEIYPIDLQQIRTIYIKPYFKRFPKLLDVGSLEVITLRGGRYVIGNIKRPYAFHKAIIGDIVAAQHYSQKY